MSKKDKWSNDWAHDEAAGRPWPIWPGSWAESPKPKAGHKLRYDRTPVPAAESQKTRKGPTEPGASGGGDLMREIQKMVSTARRADRRVRRLKEEKDKKEAQWRAFEKTSRPDLMQQRRQYESELRKIHKKKKNTNPARCRRLHGSAGLGGPWASNQTSAHGGGGCLGCPACGWGRS